MKPHYFGQESADPDDIFLSMAKGQGYVSRECLLSGQIVMGLVKQGDDPCKGCEGPRDKCKGRPKNYLPLGYKERR